MSQASTPQIASSGSGETSTLSYPAGTTEMQLLTTAGAPSSPPPSPPMRLRVSSQTPQEPEKHPAGGGSSWHASAALVAAARRLSPTCASTSARSLPSADTHASLTTRFVAFVERSVPALALVLFVFLPAGEKAGVLARTVSIAEGREKAPGGERESRRLRSASTLHRRRLWGKRKKNAFRPDQKKNREKHRQKKREDNNAS